MRSRAKGRKSLLRLFSVRQISAVLWGAVFGATLWQFYRFPQPDILEIKDASSKTVEEFNRHRVELAEGTNPVGDDGALNEAPSFERDPEEVAEWMEKMGTAPTRNKVEDKARREREKARKEREKRRSDKEEREKEFANQKPIVLGANADANNLKNTDGLDTLAPKPNPTIIVPEKTRQEKVLEAMGLKTLAESGEDESSGEEEEEGEGEGEEDDNDSDEEETGAVEKKETRRSRKAKKLAKGFVWRGALKVKGPDGRDVVDPLSLPFQDPRQLVQHLLGPAFTYPRDRMFITLENHKALHKKDRIHTLRNLPLYDPIDGPPPTCPPSARRCPKRTEHVYFPSCALVGNAGSAKAARFGSSVDMHTVVLRINQGPTLRYEKYVGSRTTYRLLGKKWVSLYTDKKDGREVLIPAEAANSTLLASRVSATEFEHLASLVRKERTDIKTLYLAQGLSTRARWMLAAFREGMAKLGVEYEGGAAPSSGFIGVYFLLQVCERIAVYGMSMESMRVGDPASFSYHYFHGYIDSQNLRAHPHHSFLAEGDLINALEQAGRLVICGGSNPVGAMDQDRLAASCGVHSGPSGDFDEKPALAAEAGP